MSDRRQLANPTNASKSTGPITENGKATASANSLRHGILSDRLFLENEDPAEFQQLQIDLQSSLAPVGAIELTLVERIAIAIWRQKRLVAAETASLNLNLDQRSIAKGVNSELDRSYSELAISEDDLQPYDTDDAAPTLVASGMGSGVGDNIAVVRVEAGGGGHVTLEFKPLGSLEEQSASPLDVARLFFPAMVEFRQGMLQLVEDPTVPTAERRISEAAVRQLEGATAMVRARGSHPMGKKLLCQWPSLCRGWVAGPGFRSSNSFCRVADTLAKACGT